MNQEPLVPMGGSSADLSPRPFSEIPSLWLKVPRMYEEFMVAELPRASGTNVLLSVLVMAALASVAMLLPLGSFAPLSVFVGFYASTGLTYLSARIFGDMGHFVEQSYLQSLFFVPLGILSWLCNLFPAGAMIGLLSL